jgi:hypothetical protein
LKLWICNGLNGAIGNFVEGFVGMAGVQVDILAVISALVTLLFEWYICYWLYTKKAFFKL